MTRGKAGTWRQRAKRLMDVALSLAALVVLSPVMLVTACLVYAHLGRPVFFVQERPGLEGRPFKLIKFRSMSDERDAAGELLPPARRLGRFGRLLRRLSLDELPELINVLRGEMSLVGPRPLRMEYMARYSAVQRRRHAMRPGLTGLAQVSGRNLQTWPERLALDVWYVDNWSLLLDLKIMWRTMAVLVSGAGAEPSGALTMQEFMGDEGTHT